MNKAAHISEVTSLAGEYILRPGQAQSIQGTRPVVADAMLGKLLKGRSSHDVPLMLGSLFTLCSHAHRRTSTLALGAANWMDSFPNQLANPPSLMHHRLETVRDHIRSMALDWPRYLQVPESLQKALQDMARMTLAREKPNTDDPHTIEKSLNDIARWLDNNLATFKAGFDELLTLQPQLYQLPVAKARCLQLLDSDIKNQNGNLQKLADSLFTVPGFTQHPVWMGQAAETGSWCRKRAQTKCDEEISILWERLRSRFSEVILLCNSPLLSVESGEDPMLSSGALSLGNGSAIAWCEMARGLLIHAVQCDEDSRIVDYRVLAPTEWNFHPDGNLAQTLAGLSDDDMVSTNCLAAAFDACVQCSMEVTTHA